jgi:hypothetical protein
MNLIKQISLIVKKKQSICMPFLEGLLYSMEMIRKLNAQREQEKEKEKKKKIKNQLIPQIKHNSPALYLPHHV